MRGMAGGFRSLHSHPLGTAEGMEDSCPGGCTLTTTAALVEDLRGLALSTTIWAEVKLGSGVTVLSLERDLLTKCVVSHYSCVSTWTGPAQGQEEQERKRSVPK